MSEIERVYVIPLKNVYRVPLTKRAKVAIRIIREFLKRHVKAEIIRISPAVNNLVWSRGIAKPPRKLQVKVKVTTEEGVRVAEVEPLERAGSS
ncbi:MAG: 50S ribosomal protein L31e [Thermofilaceae archaeon]